MSYTLITGATGGLGRALAKQLAKQGHTLLVSGRNPDKLSTLLEQLPQSAISKVADLCDPQQVDQLYQFANQQLGSPSLLINCAGSGLFGKLESLNAKDIAPAIQQNLLPVILPCHAFFTDMKQNGGIIANVMSTASLKGKAGESVYCAAKWGVKGFTESLREEAKGSGLRIVSIYPAGMSGDFWQGTSYPADTFMSPEQAAEMIVPALNQAEKGYVSEITLSR